jgi:hypothetical protein
MVLRSVYFMVKFRIFIPELWDFIHQIVCDFKAIFCMSRCKLRTPLPIHFKLRIVIVLWSVYFLVKFQFFFPELWDFIHQIVGDFSYVVL